MSAQSANSAQIVNFPDAGGRTRSFFLLFSRHSENAIADVLADHAFLHAFIAYRRARANHVVTAAELSSLLRHASVTVGIDATALELLAELVNADRTPPGPFPVARGEAPTPGENGHIEFHVQPTVSEARFDTSQNGTIDYRELNLIENCFAGQLVATRHPPGEGRPGKDIHGRVINALPGIPAVLQPGTDVLADPGGAEFTAARAGRLEMRNGQLHVTQEYEVPGDVDYRVGNIDFVGRVTVRGGVLDGFRVSGRLGVTIAGLCGACEIASETGDVNLPGGVKGRGAAVIRCGGGVKARYLDECLVEAGGDVVVDRELLNCAVHTTGRLLMPAGSVVGGEVVALRGATVGTAGSPLGVATRISVGVNWTDEATLQRIDAARADAAARAKTAQNLLEPFLADAAGIARLSVEEKNQISDLVAELAHLRGELAGLIEERNAILNKKPEAFIAILNVRQLIHAEVLLQFPSMPYRVREDTRGPISFSRPDLRSGVKMGPLLGLPDLPPRDKAPSSEDPPPMPIPMESGVDEGSEACDSRGSPPSRE